MSEVLSRKQPDFGQHDSHLEQLEVPLIIVQTATVMTCLTSFVPVGDFSDLEQQSFAGP
ncbi:hypothetical protein COOONC_22738 [Cooperia oncophora]